MSFLNQTYDEIGKKRHRLLTIKYIVPYTKEIYMERAEIIGLRNSIFRGRSTTQSEISNLYFEAAW
jgi:hypothetical protein